MQNGTHNLCNLIRCPLTTKFGVPSVPHYYTTTVDRLVTSRPFNIIQEISSKCKMDHDPKSPLAKCSNTFSPRHPWVYLRVNSIDTLPLEQKICYYTNDILSVYNYVFRLSLANTPWFKRYFWIRTRQFRRSLGANVMHMDDDRISLKLLKITNGHRSCHVGLHSQCRCYGWVEVVWEHMQARCRQSML